MSGLFRRFCPPPPPLVWFVVRRPPLFFSLALSGFARSGPGVLVLVFLFPLFFCVPLLVFSLSNFSSHSHSHLISISFSFSFPSHVRALVFYPTAVGCVCVNHLNRCKISILLNCPFLNQGSITVFSSIYAGGTGPLWIPVPTKLFHNGGSGD